MPRPLSDRDTVSSKIETYKATKEFWDLVQVIPVKPYPQFPVEAFWGKRTAMGNRADGSVWIVNLNEDDPSQNAALEAGGKVREAVACLVLHVARFDARTWSCTPILKVLPWSFGGDKFEMLKGLGLNQVKTTELFVRCKPGDKDTKFQDLMIQFAPAEKRLLASVRQNPQYLARITEEFGRGVTAFTEFLRPDSRNEQLQAMRGMDGGGGGMPQGMDFSGTRGFNPGPARGQFQNQQMNPGFNPGPSSGVTAPGFQMHGGGPAAQDPFAAMGGGAPQQQQTFAPQQNHQVHNPVIDTRAQASHNAAIPVNAAVAQDPFAAMGSGAASSFAPQQQQGGPDPFAQGPGIQVGPGATQPGPSQFTAQGAVDDPNAVLNQMLGSSQVGGGNQRIDDNGIPY